MFDGAKSSREFLKRLRGALGEIGRESTPNRRTSKRVKLPIPVQLRVEDRETKKRRLRDFSQQGLCVEAAGDGVPGESVAVRFEGYSEVSEPFILAGDIIRVTEEDPPGLVILIDRGRTPSDALDRYRTLVLHYIRHKPLLDELGKGYFEGRCESCGWIGRVGAKKPTCSGCGGRVVPVTE